MGCMHTRLLGDCDVGYIIRSKLISCGNCQNGELHLHYARGHVLDIVCASSAVQRGKVPFISLFLDSRRRNCNTMGISMKIIVVLIAD
jgi:hypothetical protein